MIVGSLGVNPGFTLVDNREASAIADEFRRAFKVSRGLPCDVPLASHPAMYRMAEKVARLDKRSKSGREVMLRPGTTAS